MMKGFFTLVRKDLLNESRRYETWTALVSISILLSVIASCGVSAAFLEPNAVRKLFPALLWMIFLFASTASVSRSFEYECELNGLGGLLLAGASPSIIFLAKFLVNFVAISLSQLFSTAVLMALLDVGAPLLPFSTLTLLVSAGYSALATLLSGMAMTAKLKGLLLPLILLPLLFPLFFCAVELGAGAMSSGSLETSSTWFSLLIVLDLVYLSLGTLLFEYVIRE